MPRLLRNMMIGAGSILELMPAQRTRFIANVRLRSAQEMLASDWQRVGQHIYRVIGKHRDPKATDGSTKQE